MSEKPETKYDVAREFNDGVVAGIRPLGNDHSNRSQHWHAGYLAGYELRKEKNAKLNQYLESIGHRPMLIIHVQRTT